MIFIVLPTFLNHAGSTKAFVAIALPTRNPRNVLVIKVKCLFLAQIDATHLTRHVSILDEGAVATSAHMRLKIRSQTGLNVDGLLTSYKTNRRELDLKVASQCGYALRETINANFDNVRSLADAVLFEFSSFRQQDLALRDRIR
jgi:hypothetical protein